MSKIDELDPELVTKCYELLLKTMSAETMAWIIGKYKSNPDAWWAEDKFHFTGGMAIRNLFRSVATDDKLPTGNWDDYYIPVIEGFLGLPQTIDAVSSDEKIMEYLKDWVDESYASISCYYEGDKNATRAHLIGYIQALTEVGRMAETNAAYIITLIDGLN